MIIVSDTTPLIGLASIGRLDLLQELFGEVYIPQAVFDETVTFGRENSKAKQMVSNASWIHVVEVKDRLAVNVLVDEMDLGEVETIVLASEMNADWVLMDEKKDAENYPNSIFPKLELSVFCSRQKRLDLYLC
ncbi:MAG: DNA-binding protein [Anaerolineales bacterium]|nr:DNA-binding protein [Anaerolineales bacterium]